MLGLGQGAEQQKWTRITRGNKIIKKVAPYYVHLSNAYAQLKEFLADISTPPSEDKTNTTNNTSIQIKHQTNSNSRQRGAAKQNLQSI